MVVAAATMLDKHFKSIGQSKFYAIFTDCFMLNKRSFFVCSSSIVHSFFCFWVSSVYFTLLFLFYNVHSTENDNRPTTTSWTSWKRKHAKNIYHAQWVHFRCKYVSSWLIFLVFYASIKFLYYHKKTMLLVGLLSLTY